MMLPPGLVLVFCLCGWQPSPNRVRKSMSEPVMSEVGSNSQTQKSGSLRQFDVEIFIKVHETSRSTY